MTRKQTEKGVAARMKYYLYSYGEKSSPVDDGGNVWRVKINLFPPKCGMHILMDGKHAVVLEVKQDGADTKIEFIDSDEKIERVYECCNKDESTEPTHTATDNVDLDTHNKENPMINLSASKNSADVSSETTANTNIDVTDGNVTSQIVKNVSNVVAAEGSTPIKCLVGNSPCSPIAEESAEEENPMINIAASKLSLGYSNMINLKSGKPCPILQNTGQNSSGNLDGNDIPQSVEILADPHVPVEASIATVNEEVEPLLLHEKHHTVTKCCSEGDNARAVDTENNMDDLLQKVMIRQKSFLHSNTKVYHVQDTELPIAQESDEVDDAAINIAEKGSQRVTVFEDAINNKREVTDFSDAAKSENKILIVNLCPLNQFYISDHIEFDRSPLPYFHAALVEFVDDNLHCIEFKFDIRNIKRKKLIDIRQTSYTLKELGQKVYKVIHSNHPYSPEEIIKRAKGLMKNPNRKGYSLRTNNCEHVVNWCVEGNPISYQINRLEEKCIIM